MHLVGLVGAVRAIHHVGELVRELLHLVRVRVGVRVRVKVRVKG